MKFEITFGQDEIRLMLWESLNLSEATLEPPELPRGPSDVDLLQQIEGQARQFLQKLVADRGGSV